MVPMQLSLLCTAPIWSNDLRGAGRKMGELTFTCPTTSQEFGTGYRFTAEEFQLVPTPATITVRCKQCRQLHQFKIVVGRIREESH